MRRDAEPMARHSWIPWLFPAAMLPVLLANAALIFFAVQSKPALVDAHPFEDGRTYNRVLAAAAAQDRLGWTATFALPESAGAPAPVDVAIRDRAGQPVRRLMVELLVERPVGAQPDRQLPLAETAPGHYTAMLTLPSAGQWQFTVTARHGAGAFVEVRRVVLR
ncbi:MAG: FixH family protein [Thiohalocapsa sp.]